MLQQTNVPFLNAQGFPTYSDHPLLDTPGTELLILPWHPKSWPLQDNATASQNQIINLGYGTDPLYVGENPNAVTEAPPFSNGKFNFSGNKRIISNGTSNYVLSNTAKLVTVWAKVNAYNTSLVARHVGNTATNLIFVATPSSYYLVWIWAGETAYTIYPNHTILGIKTGQVNQFSFSFEPEGANSKIKLFLNGRKAHETSFTGKNAMHLASSNLPRFHIGVDVPGEIFDGSFYQASMVDILPSGLPSEELVAKDYRQMIKFYQSL
jgi:hypothetical protein